MNTNPNVLILGSETEPSRHILEQIIKKQITDNSLQNIRTLHLDTKYYTADINLIQTDCYSMLNKVENVEAVILYIDCDQHKELDNLSIWKQIETVYEPEIKLLITDRASETKITRDKALQWCISKGFEFIELNYEEPLEELEFSEKYGVDRIIEVLQSHTWQNLVMKKNVSTDPSDLFNYALCDFDSKLANISIMKDKIAVLPSNQRKDYAEKLLYSYLQMVLDDSDEGGGDSDF